MDNLLDHQFEKGQGSQEKMGLYDMRLDKNYTEFLGKDPQSTIISLEQIPPEASEDTLNLLHQKMKEYTDRFSEYLGDLSDKYNDPRFVLKFIDTHYKRSLMRVLLRDTRIDTRALSLALEKTDGAIFERYNNAAGVVHAYVLNQGSTNKKTFI